jgi:hypothetical protein
MTCSPWRIWYRVWLRCRWVAKLFAISQGSGFFREVYSAKIFGPVKNRYTTKPDSLSGESFLVVWDWRSVAMSSSTSSSVKPGVDLAEYQNRLTHRLFVITGGHDQVFTCQVVLADHIKLFQHHLPHHERPATRPQTNASSAIVMASMKSGRGFIGAIEI